MSRTAKKQAEQKSATERNRLITLFYSAGERGTIVWLINRIEDMDLTAARMTASLREDLGLDEVEFIQYGQFRGVEDSEHTLNQGQVQWILDQLHKVFDKRKLAPQLDRYAISLFDSLTDALEHPDENAES